MALLPKNGGISNFCAAVSGRLLSHTERKFDYTTSSDDVHFGSCLGPWDGTYGGLNRTQSFPDSALTSTYASEWHAPLGNMDCLGAFPFSTGNCRAVSLFHLATLCVCPAPTISAAPIKSLKPSTIHASSIGSFNVCQNRKHAKQFIDPSTAEHQRFYDAET